jgi:hypothetical protein
MDFQECNVPKSSSAVGDFYVEDNCCITCGVPQAVAPDLVGWTNEGMSQCYWKKQPQTQEELRQAFAIFSGQEVGCHRYSGRDPEIQAQIGLENCDHPVSSYATASNEEATPKLTFWTEAGIFERIWAKILRRG